MRSRPTLLWSVLSAVLSRPGLWVTAIRQAQRFAPDGWWRVLYYGIPAILIVFCITHAERNNITLPRSLVQSGNASYSIYLSHLFTINVVGRAWGQVAIGSVFDNIPALILAFLVAIVAGFISYRYVETPLLKLSRRFV